MKTAGRTKRSTCRGTVEDLAAIARQQKTGVDCERMLISVDMAVPVSGQADTYAARRFAIVVEATPPAGDPKSVVKLGGTFHQNGDLTPGLFDVTHRTFTAAS